MKVLIDARKLGDGGIGVHIENLVDSLLELPESESGRLELSLLVEPKLLKSIESSERAFHRWRGIVNFYAESSKKYSFSEYFMLPLKQRRLLNTHDVYHSPHYTLPFFIKTPSVVTIHDLIHITNPENFYHKPVARALINLAASRANHVILVSHASRGSFRQTFGFTKTKKTVIPNAVRLGLTAPNAETLHNFKRKHGLDLSYFLFVGSDRPHKGFKELLHAWALVKSARQLKCESMPHLAVVGERFSSTTKELVSSLGLSENVKFLGGLSHEELTESYFGASAVVVPSREEGFGLVALEGMKCEKPVVCSPIKSLREVCGEIAYYSKDLTPEGLADALLKVLDEPDRAKAKAQAGLVRAEQFNRRHLGRATMSVYADILGVSSSGQQELIREIAA